MSSAAFRVAEITDVVGFHAPVKSKLVKYKPSPYVFPEVSCGVTSPSILKMREI